MLNYITDDIQTDNNTVTLIPLLLLLLCQFFASTKHKEKRYKAKHFNVNIYTHTGSEPSATNQ